MKKLITLPLCAATVVVGAILSADKATADSPSPAGPKMFEVTITNLTATQIFSAPIIASHTEDTRMFVPGMAASAEFQALAEDGDNSGLSAAMMADPEVLDVVTFPANITPGTSMTMIVTMDQFHNSLSIAGMLVTTNDAFFGVDSITMDRSVTEAKFLASVYDAGTEFNSEDCMYIPGPPCNNGGVHDPAAAEGFIHYSSGIHGVGTLAASEWDWGTIGASIEVRRL